MAASARWHERTLQNGSWLRADFGDLSVIVHSTHAEWRVAALTGPERDLLSGIDDPGEDLPWQRWDRGPEDTTLRFRPVFPDRPLIIRPRAPLHLSPRAKATFYIGIPAWIELSAHTEGCYTTLRAWPTSRLSNTWHGTPMEGTLCYAAKTRARREFDPAFWKPEDIVCAVEISNQSQNTLPFERLFFDTGHLAIFEHQELMWSNQARIRVGEKDAELSGIVFSPRPGGEAAKGVELSAPRKGLVRRSILRQAFSSVLGTLQDD